MSRKITIIGGGSSTFTPQLLQLFLRSRVLHGSTITLMDIDTHRLEVMDRLSHLVVSRMGVDLTIESTTDQRTALTAADFVITAISVGGMDAWELVLRPHGSHQPPTVPGRRSEGRVLCGQRPTELTPVAGVGGAALAVSRRRSGWRSGRAHQV